VTGRVLVRRMPWFATPTWEVLCPCCAARKPGVAVLTATDDWRAAVSFARAHAWIHR
jgi:hypothetical protein